MVTRPMVQRRAVRVVVCAGSKVLLIARHDPGVAGRSWWTVPGGGIDDGESPIMAAMRELMEETGIVAGANQLKGPVAVRDVTHGYSDRILHQTELFLVLPLRQTVDVDPQGLTAREKATTLQRRWCELSALDELDGELWDDPRDTLRLCDRHAFWPVTLSTVEQSTVPVTPREMALVGSC